jgi:hypothetical protein
LRPFRENRTNIVKRPHLSNRVHYLFLVKDKQKKAESNDSALLKYVGFELKLVDAVGEL